MNNDTKVTIQELKELVKKFVIDRDWDQFHSLKNLTMNLSCEANELMEFFVWSEGNKSIEIYHKNKELINNEIADVFLTLLLICNKADIDLFSAFEHKMKLNAQKYPVDKSKGKNLKYTEL